MSAARAPIVSVALNDISHDSRVRTTAAALRSAGAEVLIVGVTGRERGWCRTVEGGEVRVLANPPPATAASLPARIAARAFERPVALLRARRERRMAPLRERAASAKAARDAASGDEARRRAQRRASEAGKALAAARRRRRHLLWSERRLAGAAARMRRRATRSARRVQARRALTLVSDEVVALKPRAIHANDADGLAVAVAARRRLLGALGPPRQASPHGAAERISVVYDAGEWTVGRREYMKDTPAAASEVEMEGEAIAEADAVITASAALAQKLQERYALPERPAVVHSAPPASPGEGGASLHELAGAPPEARLLAYVGLIAERRGVGDAVRALALLPEDVWLVSLSATRGQAVAELNRIAARAGVAGRVRVAGPVAPEQVVATIRDAHLGLLPLRRNEQHEVAMPNKLFQYAQAGLPVITSDCGAAAEFVGRHRIGAVFRAGDPEDLARAVAAGLDAREEVVRRLRSPEAAAAVSWEPQRRTLLEVYAGIGVPLGPAVAEPTIAAHGLGALRAPASEVFLGIGPRNGNGNGWDWSRAVRRFVDGADAESFATDFPSGNLALDYPCDLRIPRERWESQDWQRAWLREGILGRYTHVLIEQGLSACGRLHGDLRREIPMLREHGLRVGLPMRGSEIRDPEAHAARDRFSPFHDRDNPLFATLQEQARRLRATAEDLEVPTFVTTVDLLDDLPGARWLPLMIDLERWVPGPPIMGGDGPPVVLHAPSREWTKGSSFVDAACLPLADQGLITYRRLRGIPLASMPEAIAAADIVVDQLVIGNLGTQPLQALAAGRLVVAHLPDAVRARLPEPPPVLEADPETLAQVLRDAVAAPEAVRRLASAGPAFVRRHHDGTRSAEALRPFLFGQ